MKLANLFESIDFLPTRFNKEKGYHETPSQKVERPCTVCDGTALDYPDDPDSGPCLYCKETPGRETSSEYTVPHINVSNTNAHVLLSIMNVPAESEHGTVGTVLNKDLPELKRRLLIVKNQDNKRKPYHRETTDTTTKKTTYMDRSGETPEIKTKGGARFIEFGLDDSRINQYIDELLKIISFAQEKGYDLSWH